MNPRSSTPPSLSRRCLLGTSVFASGITVMAGLAHPEPAAAGPRTPNPETVGPVQVTPLGTTSYVFDADFRSAIPFEEIVAVEVTGPRRALSGAIIQVTFDARVSLSDDGECFVVHDSIPTPRRVSNETRAGLGILRMSLPDLIDGESGEATVIIGLPLRRKNLYPNENVGAPVPTAVAVIDGSSGKTMASSPSSPPANAVTGHGWGIEVSAIWDTLVTTAPGRDDCYSYPAFVRATSVGPAAIPAGTKILLTTDADLSQLRVDRVYKNDVLSDSIAITNTDHREAGIGTLVVTVEEPLPANQSMTVATRIARSMKRARTDRVTFARAWAEAPEPSSPLQRTTGSESVDAVSDSGHPRVDSAFVGFN